MDTFDTFKFCVLVASDVAGSPPGQWYMLLRCGAVPARDLIWCFLHCPMCTGATGLVSSDLEKLRKLFRKVQVQGKRGFPGRRRVRGGVKIWNILKAYEEHMRTGRIMGLRGIYYEDNFALKCASSSEQDWQNRLHNLQIHQFAGRTCLALDCGLRN